MAEVNSEDLRKQFPPNNKTVPKPERPKLEKVTVGEIAEQKDNLGKRFAKIFFAEDVRDVRQYIVHDVLIPSLKSAVLSSLEMLFFARVGGYSNPLYRDYTKPQSSARYSYSSPRQPSSGAVYAEPSRGSGSLKPIRFRSRADAQNVLTSMMEQVDIYHEVSVMQYYDLCGQPSEFVDDKWGWTDVSRARILPTHGGYVLDLGSPMYLE